MKYTIKYNAGGIADSLPKFSKNGGRFYMIAVILAVTAIHLRDYAHARRVLRKFIALFSPRC